MPCLPELRLFHGRIHKGNRHRKSKFNLKYKVIFAFFVCLKCFDYFVYVEYYLAK